MPDLVWYKIETVMDSRLTTFNVNVYFEHQPTEQVCISALGEFVQDVQNIGLHNVTYLSG